MDALRRHLQKWFGYIAFALITALLSACGGQGAVVAASDSDGFGPWTIEKRPSQFSSSWSCPPHTDWGLPSINVDLLCREGYAAGHDPETKGPRWVIERLTLGNFVGPAQRKDNFRADPDLAKGRRAELNDYSGSGLDRGHMAAAANMVFSQRAMDESFYLSNIIPQNPGLNRGQWARLEEEVRNWVGIRETLYVITGPVFRTNRVIGDSSVRIPDALFKVIFDPLRRQGIAFLIPNELIDQFDATSYRVSVDEIEYQTGLKLLSSQ
jgi:endonuclease G